MANLRTGATQFGLGVLLTALAPLASAAAEPACTSSETNICGLRLTTTAPDDHAIPAIGPTLHTDIVAPFDAPSGVLSATPVVSLNYQPTETSSANGQASFTSRPTIGLHGEPTSQAGVMVRVGASLRDIVPPLKEARAGHSSIYLFAASEGDAVAYLMRNGAAEQQSGLRSQQRVALGSVSAGVTMEYKTMQASLAYVKRDVTAIDLIRFHQDEQEEFAGLTVSIKR